MKKIARSLDDSFIYDLKYGILKNLLRRVHKDSTIDLQMRNNSIDIYYRGGVILHLEQKVGYYNASINQKYFGKENVVKFKEKIINENDIQEWIELVSKIKEARDFHYSTKNTVERDFMQLTVRTNNYEKEIVKNNIIITDVEYDFIGKIDLLALILTRTQKKLDTEFAFIEGKYATSSSTGKSGLVKHLSDIQEFISNHSDEFTLLKDDTKKIFKQKMELNLYNFDIKHIERELTIEDAKPKFIILLADYKISDSNLKDLIESINEDDYPKLDIRFSISSLMGYRLYKNCLFTKLETLEYIKNFSNGKI